MNRWITRFARPGNWGAEAAASGDGLTSSSARPSAPSPPPNRCTNWRRESGLLGSSLNMALRAAWLSRRPDCYGLHFGFRSFRQAGYGTWSVPTTVAVMLVHEQKLVAAE